MNTCSVPVTAQGHAYTRFNRALKTATPTCPSRPPPNSNGSCWPTHSLLLLLEGVGRHTWSPSFGSSGGSALAATTMQLIASLGGLEGFSGAGGAA